MQASGTEVHNYLEVSAGDPLKYLMDNPILTVFICTENPLEYKGLKIYSMSKIPAHRYRGSYMSAHVLLILLNKLGKR